MFHLINVTGYLHNQKFDMHSKDKFLFWLFSVREPCVVNNFLELLENWYLILRHCMINIRHLAIRVAWQHSDCEGGGGYS